MGTQSARLHLEGGTSCVVDGVEIAVHKNGQPVMVKVDGEWVALSHTGWVDRDRSRGTVAVIHSAETGYVREVLVGGRSVRFFDDGTVDVREDVPLHPAQPMADGSWKDKLDALVAGRDKGVIGVLRDERDELQVLLDAEVRLAQGLSDALDSAEADYHAQHDLRVKAERDRDWDRENSVRRNRRFIAERDNALLLLGLKLALG